MRLVTWNVNSVRTRQERLLAWLAENQPDVMCLQETKCEDTVFPAEVYREAGYHAVFRGQKTYNGVAVLSREPVQEVARELPGGGEQARFIDIETSSGERVICVYVPNGREVGSDHFHYKLDWLGKLRDYLDATCDPAAPLALVGDFNIAPDERDVHDPKAYEGQVHFHPEEHAALRRICEWGLKDGLRLHHEDAGIYSWWDYRMLAFPKNRGLRIDLVLVTDALAARCEDVRCDRNARKGKKPSDHVPVVADFRDA